MALTKSQHNDKELSAKCGNILVNFLNDEGVDDPIYNLSSAFRKYFKVNLFNPKNARTKQKSSIIEAQHRLAKFLDELQIDNNIRNNETIEEYNWDYYHLCHSQVVPDARLPYEMSVLSYLKESSKNPFEAVLAFLVFNYLKYEDRKEIKKCKLPNCDLYFQADNNRRQFCSKKDKMAYCRLNKIAKPEVGNIPSPAIESSDSLEQI
jgi:hypothetical protein